MNKIIPQYIISKVMELVAKGPKALSNQDQITFIIEMGLNDQDNDFVCGVEGDETGC